jgi:DNA-directed RNA polymerase subunit K/omega
MDFKRIRAKNNTTTLNLSDMHRPTGNVYETVVILSKRANQISVEMKEELDRKLSEFAIPSDNLEEVFENREQIEVAKFYEQLPKPTLISVNELLRNRIYFRNPAKEIKE